MRKRMEKQKILIVDDEEVSREMLKNLLEAEYECVTAENGRKAMEWMESHQDEIEVVLTDLVMPVMDGFELLDYIADRYQESPPPIIVITAYNEQDLVQKALLHGASEVVIKPYEPAVVKKRIENVIALNETRSVHNVMEDIIREEIDKNIDALGICQCPVCRKDLLTLALNKVQPKYVTSWKGALLTKMDNSFDSTSQIQLIAEITHCAEMVKQRPRHSVEN